MIALEGDNRAMHHLALALTVLTSLHSSHDDGLSTRIEAALTKAQQNRGQIEEFLARASKSGDTEENQAARWIVANMDGHGFTEFALTASDGATLPFDALDYKSLDQAKHALGQIEAKHPNADFKKARFDSDLQHATADFLTTHLREALHTWRTMPWSKSIHFEVFCDFILPYRGSNEPLGMWRAPARERLATLVADNSSVTDVVAFGEQARKSVHGWVGFSDLFYLHPTDQSYAQMCERKLGRCEDITNMISFGMRSVAAMCASDYTPWWADRDNNHAWEVVLDAQGRGRAGLSNRCAKVYRKTFAIQADSLALAKREDETVPSWLSSSHFRDVTSQYLPVSDVAIDLTNVPENQRFAYLAVFNGGVWRPIQWTRLSEHHARFTGMGRDICYLPMVHVGEHDLPAGAPFVLDKDGGVHPLAAKETHATTLTASITKPTTADADTGAHFAQTTVKPATAYELFVWKDGWTSCGRIENNQSTHAFTGIVGDGVYWLVEDGSEKLERIFTVEDGRQVFW